MKAMKRRLLSLFMAMVMVCTLAPMALAEDGGGKVKLTASPTEINHGGESKITLSLTAPEGKTRTKGEWEISGDKTGATLTPADDGMSATLTAKETCPDGTLTVTYTATWSDNTTNSGSVTVTVKGSAAVEASVSVSPKTLTLTSGTAESKKITATVTGSDQGVDWNIPTSISSAATISGENTNELTITPKAGLAQNVTGTVTAKLKGDASKSDSCAVTINKAAAQSYTATVKASPNPIEPLAKSTITVETNLPAAEYDAIKWSSSNASAAYFANAETTAPANTLTGVTAGKTSVSVEFYKSGTKVSNVTVTPVTVTVAAAAYTVEITGGASVAANDVLQLTAKVKQNGVEIATQPTFTWDSSNKTNATVSTSGLVTGRKAGSATITAECTIDNVKYTGEKQITVTDNPFEIRTTDNKTLTSWDRTIELIPYFNGKEYTDTKVTWSRTNSTYFDYSSGRNNRIVVEPEAASKTEQTARFTATATIDGKDYTATIDLYLKFSAEISLTASVSDDYYLGDVSDKGSYSVEDQLLKAIPNNHELYYVRFSNVTTSYGELDGLSKNEKIYVEDIADVLFVPIKKGDAVFNFTAYTYTTNTNNLTEREGILTITVTDESSTGGDVVFYGEVGENVPFDTSSFEDFWDDNYPGGDLEYVTFSVSGGTLRDADDKTVGAKECHVRASSRQIDLDEVTFEPSSANKKKATTITFSFTAYGENKSGTDKEASGKVSIVYMSDSPDDISYTVGSSGTVSLKASDFTDAYKEVISGSVPSNLTIVFQNVPKNGTLTYTNTSKKDTKLTSSNIKKYSFTTKSSGNNRLDQVSYSGTSGTDTIEYTAYSGSTPKFKGKVVFNGKAAVSTNVVVGPFYSTGGLPATFGLSEFTKANSAISNATKIRFVAPANGTLTMNGVSAAGTDIATSMVNLVSYQPRAGYNGTDQISFAAYDSKSTVVASGTVSVQVIGNPTTTTPTTPGGSTGVSDVSQFTDVSSTAWYRSNLATLVQKGVISGRGNGKFDPRGTVTYGEALKMVLEACGYTATVGTGSQWAINYKNLAVSRGWISSDIDLNAAISRNATAELAAKVLGVSPVTSGSPFADEANAYAVALYYTTPQVFVGSTNPNGGKPLFQNSSPLLREQVCAVICRVMDYHTQHTTNAMPDGT